MRHSLRHSFRKWITAFFLSPLLTFTSSGFAAPLWQQVESSQYSGTLSEIQLPDDALNSRPIEISQSTLGNIKSGDTLSVSLHPELAEGQFQNLDTHQTYDYQISETYEYINGGLGWRANLDAIDTKYVLSFSRSSNLILGTIHSPSGKYKLILKQVEDQTNKFAGWIYREPARPDIIAIDNGPVVVDGATIILERSNRRTLSKLTNDDVSINQTLKKNGVELGQSEFVTVGDEVEVTIDITNISASAIPANSFVVFFILDVTDLISSSSNCAKEDGFNGPDPAILLICQYDSISINGSEAFSYTLLTKAQTYPQVTSTVIFDEARDDAFLFVARDLLTDSDNDGISDFNEQLTSTDPNDSNSVISSDYRAEIDLLFLYTQKFLDDIGHGDPEAEINQIVLDVNTLFAASSVGVNFRPVHYSLTNYQVNNDLNSALDAVDSRSSSFFSDLDYLRETHGADMIVLIDGDFVDDIGEVCGLAFLGANRSLGDMGATQSIKTSISTAYRPGVTNCSGSTLAHELGHNMGLSHSRVESSIPGTFLWATGHGLDNSFHTIMAYASHFPGSSEVGVFSNPESSACSGFPCGVEKDDLINGANSVLALNTTRFQTSDFFEAQPTLSVATLTGESTSAKMLGGAIKSGATSFNATFNVSDVFNVQATVKVASEHVGQTGITHVLLSAGDLGFFQINSSGGIVSWNLQLETLVGSIEPRPLKSTEELIALKQFSGEAIGIDSLSLTVFFAYSVPGTDIFVFTAEGIAFSITP